MSGYMPVWPTYEPIDSQNIKARRDSFICSTNTC